MADITDARKKQERRYVFCIVAMVAVCLAVAVMELSMGALSIDPIESVLALFGIGSAQDVNTVQSIRLPRTACAIVSGAGLALAGAALQSVLENPLASASTVGISQGAAFGATVAILIIVPTVFGSSSEMGDSHRPVRICGSYGVERRGIAVFAHGACHAGKHYLGRRCVIRIVGWRFYHHAVLLRRP